jgi:hypothetical protein
VEKSRRFAFPGIAKNLSGLGLLQGLVPTEHVGGGFTRLDEAGLPVRKPEHDRAIGK